MSEQWRILVVEDQQDLNRNIVNSLRKDGYMVHSVTSGAEAIRLLWTEKYNVVICDQKMPDADGFELLQWIRSYCPQTRMIMVAALGSPITRAQALEGGVVSYLERPVDLRVLKEELRRLLQQTGFSASLDSFDLLDVIQIITMSHKTIALVVNTGLEEQGLLRFQGGEMIWAEYGILRGEEAFFALAAHKNGTVIHQPWNEQIAPNVTQPLSRLIFQALQYRAKYAAFQQLSGEHEVVTPLPALQEVVDDRPFVFEAESQAATQSAPLGYHQEAERLPQTSLTAQEANLAPIRPANDAASSRFAQAGRKEEAREWWQQSGKHTNPHQSQDVGAVTGGSTPLPPSTNGPGHRSIDLSRNAGITPSTVRKTAASQRGDLPAWLMDQPTQFDLPAMRLSSPGSGTGQVPVTPVHKAAPAEWQPTPPKAKAAEQAPSEQTTGSKVAAQVSDAGGAVHKRDAIRPPHQPASPEWQPPEEMSRTGEHQPPLKSLSRKTGDLLAQAVRSESGPLATSDAAVPLSNGSAVGERVAGEGGAGAPALWEPNGSDAGSQRTLKRNYSALVAALQTLGYSIAGFVATAIVSQDGQPIAQVAVDDLDVSLVCGYFSTILQGVLLSLDRGRWGHLEQTVISSATHHIVLRIVGSNRDAFQVLITTHEADPAECLEVMANVEGAIASALR